MDIRKGDIVFVDNPFQSPHGAVICGSRPAVVIQNNKGNEYSNNIIVAYLTSQLKRIEMTTHVILQWYPGLKKTSMVQAEQIATISKSDVTCVIDHLRPEDQVRVDQAIKASLALEEVS